MIDKYLLFFTVIFIFYEMFYCFVVMFSYFIFCFAYAKDPVLFLVVNSSKRTRSKENISRCFGFILLQKRTKNYFQYECAKLKVLNQFHAIYFRSADGVIFIKP